MKRSSPRHKGTAITTAGLYYRTARYLRPQQMLHLGQRVIVRKFKGRLSRDHKVAAQPSLAWPSGASFLPAVDQALLLQMVETGRFTFLNLMWEVQGKPPWEDRELPQLWKLNLHYFDYANVVVPEDRLQPWLVRIQEMVTDWLLKNPVGEGTGWLPYAVSLRIVNWLKMVCRYGQMLDERVCQAICASLYLHAKYLFDNVEYDLLANHLVKNAKALMFAGAMLASPESDQWWMIGTGILEDQLREQVLPDGGHYERSPMYHAEVLEDLLELKDLTAGCEKPFREEALLQEKIILMREFLAAILHPDGEIPLFNDSVCGIARPSSELLAMEAFDNHPLAETGKVGTTILANTGYAVVREPDTRSALIFDCGPLGPDYQPGHGHCDVLSYELSLYGRRVIVDTGVSTYERGNTRHYERSTSAHNTLRIDGEDQAEIWASFRVGRRPRVGPICAGEYSGTRWVRGEHYGFLRRGVRHIRLIVCTARGAWLIVDCLQGLGMHLIESFVHFHPAVSVIPLSGVEISSALEMPRKAIIGIEGHEYFVSSSWPGRMVCEESFYAPQFGHRVPQRVLRWTVESALPTTMLSALVPAHTGGCAPEVSCCEGVVTVDGVKIPLV